MINEKYGNKIDVLIPNIEVKGTGKNTTDLTQYVKKFVNYSSKVYGKVFVVFDKDDYDDNQFNKAIKDCEYNSCWSNPNFELWILVHLKKVSKFISKDNVLKELNKEFQNRGFGNYSKNDKNIFEKVTKDKNLYIALENCKYMEELNSNEQFARRNPMTKVYKIIEELDEYLK